MGRTAAAPTPLVLAIDVEPAGFQVHDRGAASTAGVALLGERIGAVRDRIAQRTGRPPSFGWYFRMDDQVGAAYGRLDRLHAEAEPFLDPADHLGLHSHPVRRDDEQGVWVHDLAPEVQRRTIDVGIEAFTSATGQAPLRHRVGARLDTAEALEHLSDRGFRVELGVEPHRRLVGEVRTPIDASPLLGVVPASARPPRAPYAILPRHLSASEVGHLTVLSMTGSRLATPAPIVRTTAHAVRRRRMPVRRAFSAQAFADPVGFWDRVRLVARLGRLPYLNLAVRTDSPETRAFARTAAILDALPSHPLVDEVELVDPLVLPGVSVAPGADLGAA